MSIFHLKWPHMKHEENSLRGIRNAKRWGDSEIDIDMQITIDNVIVGCHWSRPLLRDGFRDPKHKVGKFAKVSKLPWSTVARLRAGRAPVYRIQRIERLLQECAKVGIGAVLEPKGDPRFQDPKVWEHIAQVADDCGAHVRVYALKANRAALPAARSAGFHATELSK